MMLTAKILKNPCFQYICDVSQITDEYFRGLPLNFMGHARVKRSGEFFFLNSGFDWTADHFVRKEIPPLGFQIFDHMSDRLVLPKMDSGREWGWDDETIREAADKFNVQNPMFIARQYDDFYEVFIFDYHHEDGPQFYLDNLQFFENYMHFHKDKASALIDVVKKKPLQVQDKYLPDDIKLQKLSKNTKLRVKKYYLKLNNHDIAISSKEYQCLEMLARGARIAHVAERHKNSSRTIETHIQNMKKKFDVPNTQELIKIYWSNKLAIN